MCRAYGRVLLIQPGVIERTAVDVPEDDSGTLVAFRLTCHTINP